MPRETIELTFDGKVASLVLNRPEKRNAINEKMQAEFEDAVAQVRERDDASVLIISGAGGSFSAGYDVTAQPRDPNRPRPDIVADRARLEKTLGQWMLLRALPQPVIAAVEGHCIGGGTQICSMCDIIVAAEDAQIAWPGLPLGGGYISPMWTWFVGPGRAKYMSLRPGSSISGREASEWGWATLAVPAGQLHASVQRLAEEIARVPLPVLQVKKAAINRQMDIMGFSTAVSLSVEWNAILHDSDAVKGVRAMIREKGLRQAIQEFRGAAD